MKRSWTSWPIVLAFSVAIIAIVLAKRQSTAHTTLVAAQNGVTRSISAKASGAELRVFAKANGANRRFVSLLVIAPSQHPEVKKAEIEWNTQTGETFESFILYVGFLPAEILAAGGSAHAVVDTDGSVLTRLGLPDPPVMILFEGATGRIEISDDPTSAVSRELYLKFVHGATRAK